MRMVDSYRGVCSTMLSFSGGTPKLGKPTHAVFINLGDVKVPVMEREVRDLLNHVIAVKPGNGFFLFLFFHHYSERPELSV